MSLRGLLSKTHPFSHQFIDGNGVHDFHGSADNPSEWHSASFGHQLNLVLSDKYRAGYAAQGMRHASLPAVVSTSGRIHGDLPRLFRPSAPSYKLPYSPSPLRALVSSRFSNKHHHLRLLYILADKKTTRYFEALGEAVDVDSEAYCWRRSGFFWRTRASLGLACAQATTLCT